LCKKNSNKKVFNEYRYCKDGGDILKNNTYSDRLVNCNRVIPPVWYGEYPIYYDPELGEKIYNKLKVIYRYIINKLGSEIIDFASFIKMQFSSVTFITYGIVYN